MQTEPDAGTALVAKALVPYNQKPDEVEIALLTDDLLCYGAALARRAAGRERATAAMRDWDLLTSHGPTDSPVGNWNHARALARTVKAFRRALGEQ
ncbi:DUF6415 family natural product biosynthesis protein [Streptomyces erythrochromogenes]|uniref:DUF6415 family natural product biosynthesis protein n=1 Tax=Streptomyces erythrochromogenes TaxID=285574 RepID=UPI0036B86656